MGNNCIGCATVEKEGLYYRICCNCRLTEGSVFRVVAMCTHYRQSLGILVPEESGFTVTARIPVKKIDLSTLRFLVESLNADDGRICIPISVDMDVSCLPRLEESRLRIQNGSLFLAIKRDDA